ncbi:MAG TPA: alpha/beta hydrolase [Allosphingosinicella sp.]|jgi:pimeloyl-ACP methyl ester carboxylesterase
MQPFLFSSQSPSLRAQGAAAREEVSAPGPRLRRLAGALLGATILALAVPAAAAPAKPAPVLKLEPYMFKLSDGTQLPAERGTFSVPEERGNPKSRRINIGFVRLKSTSATPGNPLVYVAGGPGGSGVASAEGARQAVFLALRAAGDVIMLDQRGTGFSNHIPSCTAQRRFDPAVTLTDATLTAYYRETLRYCVGKWTAAGVAVNGYTTLENAADIEDLRRALGAKKIDLWAISYGTQLAMATMRRYPKSIGRVVLSSVDGVDQNIKLPAAVDATYKRIEGAMPKPGLIALMRRVNARFDAAPQSFTFTPKTGPAVTFKTDSFPLRMMAGILPKDPAGIGQLFGAYSALDAGQGAALAPQIYSTFYQNPLTMGGMSQLMDISSGLSETKAAKVRAQIPGSLLGDAINFPVSRLIGEVPGVDLGNAYRGAVRSKIPVLVLSGDLDVRTPLEEQAEAISGLRKRHQIIVRNGGHDLFEAHQDIPKIMIDFFAGRPVAVTELNLPKPALVPPRQ